MKFIEIRGGLLQPVSNEENVVMERVRGHVDPLPKHLLDPRESELARGLVRRGLLTRIMFEDKLCFTVNDLEELWES
jgi:hypothetical protein